MVLWADHVSFNISNCLRLILLNFLNNIGFVSVEIVRCAVCGTFHRDCFNGNWTHFFHFIYDDPPRVICRLMACSII